MSFMRSWSFYFVYLQDWLGRRWLSAGHARHAGRWAHLESLISIL